MNTNHKNNGVDKVLSYKIPREVNNCNISNTDCGNINDTNKPTAATVSSGTLEDENKASECILKELINNSLSKLNMKCTLECPMVFVEESKQSLEISEQELENIILQKFAEILATKSRFTEQINNINKLSNDQHFYKAKYKLLENEVQSIIEKLKLMNHGAFTDVQHVRNVGTDVQMPDKKTKFNS